MPMTKVKGISLIIVSERKKKTSKNINLLGYWTIIFCRWSIPINIHHGTDIAHDSTSSGIGC